MNRNIRKVLLAMLATAAAAVLFAAGAWAAPALSVEQQFTQPGGESFYATPFGDEFFNYAVAQDGAVLTRGEDGWWAYAGTGARYLVSPAPANAQSEADLIAAQDFSARPGLGEPIQFGGEGFGLQARGDQHLLVLLVDFTDVQIEFEDQWAEAIFGEENSVRAYFGDISGGAVNFVPVRETQGTANDGIVRVRLNYRHPNTANFTGRANQLITRDALREAARYVDYAAYDTNRNMVITPDEMHVLVIVAGYEAAFRPENQPNIWAHHWGDVMQAHGLIGGRMFSNYMQVGEKHDHRMATIGIIAHELGHSLGLPDLYANGVTGGLGGYCLMANGSWGRRLGEYSGQTPVGISAYGLERLGLFAPRVIPFGGSFNGAVNSLSTGEKNILRIDIPGHPQEYFLIENRQFEGWDGGLHRYTSWDAQGGIAAYRVNTRYRNNLIEGQQRVILLEASEHSLGFSMLRDPQRGSILNNDALFYVAGTRNATIHRSSVPSNALYAAPATGWFRFGVLSESAPAMDIEIQPTITIQPTQLLLDYRSGSAQLQARFAAGGDLTWAVRDSSIATVDGNGLVSAQRQRGTTYVTVQDAAGDRDTIQVTVGYAWWQWFIVILLFGWLWY